MRIEYPTDAEREASIQAILSAGLEERPTLWKQLFDLLRAVGLRGTLFGVGDCVALAILLAACALLPLTAILCRRGDSKELFYPLTAGAPLLYAALLLLTFWKEEQLGTRELKMTVRHDLRQLTAMRLVLFSGIAAAGDALLAALAAVWWRDGLLFSQLLALSLGALFVYVVLTLLGLLYIPARLQAALPAAWCALCLLPGLLLPYERLQEILAGLPLVGTVLLTLLAAATAYALTRVYLRAFRPRDTSVYC